MSDTKLVEIKQ